MEDVRRHDFREVCAQGVDVGDLDRGSERDDRFLGGRVATIGRELCADVDRELRLGKRLACAGEEWDCPA